MKLKIQIAEDLTLPIDVVTQTISIIAKRRVGKSYTMRRIAEQLFKAGQQIVIVDPKGDQWGIRSAADGKSPGLPVVILGGERGDVPLEVGSGEVVAKLVTEERVSVLLDLSLFRKHEVATFMTAFLENLYRLKAREIYRTPLQIIIDEADAIAPQKPQQGEERMLGAAEDIVRRGGQRGIGCILVTQRSAVLNKNVLTQSQILVALRTIAPQDLKAMDEWIQVHGERDQRKTLMDSLPSLPVGDAWFWSPGWPTTEGIFKRIHVLPIETFDSGATPKPGVKPVEPKNLADVDLNALKNQMSETIQRAKDNDPAELKRQLREAQQKALQAERKLTAAQQKPAEVKREETKVPVMDAACQQLFEKVQKVCSEVLEETERRAHELKLINKWLEAAKIRIEKALPSSTPKWQPVHDVTLPKPQAFIARVTKVEPERVTAEVQNGEFKINGTQQRILNAIAWYESLGNPNPTNTQIGAIALIDPSGGYFSNIVGPLSSEGYVERGNGTTSLTHKGRVIAQLPDRIGTLEDYHQVLKQRILNSKNGSGLSLRIFDAIAANNGAPITCEEIGQRAGVDHTGGYFSNGIGPLSTIGLIDRDKKGTVTPTDVMFPKGLA